VFADKAKGTTFICKCAFFDTESSDCGTLVEVVREATGVGGFLTFETALVMAETWGGVIPTGLLT